MPTQLLSLGPPFLMLANVAYALPAVACSIYTDAATPTITQSDDVVFTTSTAVTLTGGTARLTGGFIKAAANTLVTLKRD